jgi:L-glyceraldehyde reductase
VDMVCKCSLSVPVAMGVTQLINEPFVKSIAEKLGATPAQVLIAWGAYRGYSVLPKSVNNGEVVY